MPSTAHILTRPNSAPAPAPAPRGAGPSSQSGFAAQVEPLLRAADDAPTAPTPRVAPPTTPPPAKPPTPVPDATNATSAEAPTADEAAEPATESEHAEATDLSITVTLTPDPAAPLPTPIPKPDTTLAAQVQPGAIADSSAVPSGTESAETEVLGAAEPGPPLPPGLSATLAPQPGAGRAPVPAGRPEPQTRTAEDAPSAAPAATPAHLLRSAAHAEDAPPAALPMTTVLTAAAGPAHSAPKLAAEPASSPTTPDGAAVAALPPAAPTPPPGPSAAIETAAPAPPSRPHPIAQLAPTFTAIAQPGDSAAAKSLIIRLDPAELGHVQVRIDRPTGGPARVELIVERTDTLMMLMQDRPRLDQALTQAGVPPEGRTLQFNLGSQDQGAREHAGHSRPASGAWPEGAQSAEPLTIAPTARWQRAGIDITA